MDNGFLLHHSTQHIVNRLQGDNLVLVSFIQKLMGFCSDGFLIEIQMSVQHGLVKHKPQRTFDPERIIRAALRFTCDVIHRFEAKTADAAQLKRAVLQYIHCIHTELAADFGAFLYAYTVRCKIRNNLPDSAALTEGLFDHLQLFLSNAFDLKEAFGIVLHDLNSIKTEGSNDGFRFLLTDAFDQTGGKVCHNAVLGFRNDFGTFFHLELQTVFAVLPGTVHVHFNHRCGRQMITDCGKADHTVTVIVGTAGSTGNRFILGFE